MIRTVLFIAVLFSLGAQGSQAAIPRIEAEFYFDSHDNPESGDVISRHECTAASGGLGVDGMTCSGEWIMLDLLLQNRTTFHIGLRSAASEEYSRRFGVRFLNADLDNQFVAGDTLDTLPGLGIT
jgi:hypothetical protein